MKTGPAESFHKEISTDTRKYRARYLTGIFIQARIGSARAYAGYESRFKFLSTEVEWKKP